MIKATNPILNYGRDLIGSFIKEYGPKDEAVNLLDIGCGGGFDLINVQRFLNANTKANLYGVEINDDNIKISEAKGIQTAKINIETDIFPFPDNFFDIIIMNQVLEHTKEIFFIASQMNRILKHGGLLIIGVPNLAALHNRILLLLGKQPTCIRTFGPHVRGFTKNDLIDFFHLHCFSALKSGGANFYPFPKSTAKLLSKLFPTLAVGLFVLFKKTGTAMTKEYLTEQHFETNFKI